MLPGASRRTARGQGFGARAVGFAREGPARAPRIARPRARSCRYERSEGRGGHPTCRSAGPVLAGRPPVVCATRHDPGCAGVDDATVPRSCRL